MGTTDLLGPNYYGVSRTLVDKYKHETKILPIMCHNITVGTGTSYYIIVIRRYSPVRATGIMPEDTCSKAITGPIVVQQDCDRPNYIKSKRPDVWPNIKAITGPIILLRRYVPVQATRIMTEGTAKPGETNSQDK